MSMHHVGYGVSPSSAILFEESSPGKARRQQPRPETSSTEIPCPPSVGRSSGWIIHLSPASRVDLPFEQLDMKKSVHRQGKIGRRRASRRTLSSKGRRRPAAMAHFFCDKITPSAAAAALGGWLGGREVRGGALHSIDSSGVRRQPSGRVEDFRTDVFGSASGAVFSVTPFLLPLPRMLVLSVWEMERWSVDLRVPISVLFALSLPSSIPAFTPRPSSTCAIGVAAL